MAAAVAEHFGLTGDEIAAGILHFAPTKMRMNILRRAKGITILNDAYNANPQSMRAAVEVLAQTKGAYKIAVLGDMFELGPLAPALHAGVGEYLGRAGVGCLVAVGDLAHYIYNAAAAAPVPEVYHCATKEEAKPLLAKVLVPNATVLVKASRGMAFEELVDYLKSITEEP
jgi:UDP-N-acetylmuramoyl-tripeptide--D-alanyl-D-alanine ligase